MHRKVMCGNIKQQKLNWRKFCFLHSPCWNVCQTLTCRGILLVVATLFKPLGWLQLSCANRIRSCSGCLPVSIFCKPTQSHDSKLKYRRFQSYIFCTLLLFPFHLLPSPVHPTGFSSCSFPGFLAIFTLLSSNIINNASYDSPGKNTTCAYG